MSFFGMLGHAPRCMDSFPVGEAIAKKLSSSEIAKMLTLLWTDRKVVRLVARDKLDLKFEV